MDKHPTLAVIQAVPWLASWCRSLFGLVALALVVSTVSGCAKLLGGPYDKVFIVDNGAAEGGVPGTVVASCVSRKVECGEFFDDALGVTFQCGGCASNERCITNQCVCDTVSCQELEAECGFQNNGCNQLMTCGKCEDLYPGDPTKAYCNAKGKCGPAPILPTTCEEVRETGQAADCGIVGVGEMTLDCGQCPGREQCINNRCEGYEPLTCDDLTGGGLLCGTFPNGAGGEITCACASGERCTAGNVCCSPRTVCPADSCGVMPDGCGGTIDCGGCGDGETCLSNTCCGSGTPRCPTGVCGPQVVVCGQVLSCGCDTGECCIGDEDGSGTCRQPACPTDGSCGDGLDNGCGGKIDGCGCPANHVCNADGMCQCVPRGCPEDGSECGMLDDGCGGFINCFQCPQEGEQMCHQGTCCTPSCPADGSCGLVSNGCGGQKTCGCAEGEACIDGKCATPECPTGAKCGINLVGGLALSCRGTCANGQACAQRADGIYACGDCPEQCPNTGDCGLLDLGCTILSCDGSCSVESQSCVNRAVGDGPDNYTCCTPSCPNVNEATCGDNVDPLCGGQTVSCRGVCPGGQRCVIGSSGKYECVTPTCPAGATCGQNPAEPEGTIQCNGSCSGTNDSCQQQGNGVYACVCQVITNPCGNRCGQSASNGCGGTVPCSCPANEECVDGQCCLPEPDRVVCEQAGAECGTLIESRCMTEVACGLCQGDQTCTNNQCVCDPTKCDAHETCDAATQLCKCDSSKCPAGQSCTSQGVCSCDSSKCPDGKVCNAQGMCACPQTAAQACAGATCGTAVNTCDETVSCGACPANRTCSGGACVCRETAAEACEGLACGTSTNDCMEPVTCPNTCDATTEQCSGNQCVCRETATLACQRLGFECGPATNNCGAAITCPNTCTNNEHCDSNQCVCNETPEEACERQNLCGVVTGKQDACGTPLTNCGECEDDYECVNNACVCEETVEEACARLNLCGNVTGQDHTTLCEEPLTQCGTCAANQLCQNNQCVCNDTACDGRVCGTVTSSCTSQPIACGTCASGSSCAADGSACVPDAVVDGGRDR